MMAQIIKHTKIIEANKSNSMRTTIPIAISKALDLKVGDRMMWIMEENGKIELRGQKITVSDVVLDI